MLAFVLSKVYRATLDYAGKPPHGFALANTSPGITCLTTNSALVYDHASNLSNMDLAGLIKNRKLSLLRRLLQRASATSVLFSTFKQSENSSCISVPHRAVFVDAPEIMDLLCHFVADMEIHCHNEDISNCRLF